MRGKRSKQYRKLMQQYGITYGFREAYQVIVDADIIKDADKFKMDLHGGLERTLHGTTKLLITQCSMRHLYAAASEPGVSYLIDKAKTYERRRCGHKPEDYPEPLSTKECLCSVVDPKSSGTNKHRYVIATQDIEVRREMRQKLGVPLVYINKSVMVMEPMSDQSKAEGNRIEQRKFRDGLRGERGLKRKLEETEDGVGEAKSGAGEASTETSPPKKKKKKLYNINGRIKEPNPLSVKKPQKKVPEPTPKKVKHPAPVPESTDEPVEKTKRKRTHAKKKPEAECEAVVAEGEGAES